MFEIYEKIYSLLSSIYPLSDEIREIIPAFFLQHQFPKRTLLLEEGQICDRVYFIDTGLARAFYNLDGQDTTAWFMEEGDIIISVQSFFLQKPSSESIELLEDSTLVSIRYTDLQHLYHQFPAFNFNGRVLTERYYVKGEERATSLRRLTAQERYLNLLETNPKLFNRAPLKHIASFLGMAPETLSRLRAKER
ncbi:MULTISPECIES: Crp/Fnr family transcriptional regulator [Xanthocytophaga]|uniref:Crp/Fnr family transcriptional regulator n=2 Tax=Xanthocytophaga TaxID=3078918 RepID=A0AAE3U8N7_9BACT|nr:MULTISPECIES: Crp/Fnr family transcriptional regulator [Xanthocytophaga]MDJ1484214.1 Crp/Fnr family transcriptional regulator [Xanthocytophaga flavus]MDJ1503560.1 Crp/Fnr family transcriptional regulator [Xanthocytophaga agilis]